MKKATIKMIKILCFFFTSFGTAVFMLPVEALLEVDYECKKTRNR